MLKGRNIIVFGEDWGRFPSTTQHIARVFLKYNRIMWIGSMGHRKPNLNLKDFRRSIEKIKNVFSGSKVEIHSKVPTIVNPFIIPLHDSRLIRNINNKSLLRKLKNVIEENNFENPVLITSSPLISEVINELGESSSNYFCLDDYSHFEGAFKSMLSLERKLLDKISCCFAVSDLLVKTRVPKTGNSFFLPQGVDTNHFKRNKTHIPNELKNIKKPIIGFFGLVSEWIDLSLIVQSAKRYPEYVFVVIGKPSVDVSVLSAEKNIIFLGEISFDKLPFYASSFDVGLIPFKVNELTIACNPLKLLEYLSLGIPVVSTNLPEVQKFKQHIFIADGDDEFIKKIKDAVDDVSEEKNNSRRKVAEKYSWESIAGMISEKIMLYESNKAEN